MDSCIHPECNKVRKITGLLFDGQPMMMVDASEDTPGAMPYGAECSLTHPRGYFQAQDPDTLEWFLVTVYRITDPVTNRRLDEFSASIDAQAGAPADEEGEIVDA